jgi:predicted secreted hydrolase
LKQISDISEAILQPIERITSEVLDRIADLVVGEASSLRDGTEHIGVELPRDLYAHADVQTEWWYYTGNMQTSGGHRFGFEFVFFKRRTDLDRFGVFPLRLLANPLYLAHFAVTDETDGSFRYEHIKSAGGMLDLPARVRDDRYYLRLGKWSIREVDQAHVLRATIGNDLVFEARLKSTKPPALNGHAGEGVSFKDQGEASRYFSLTRMTAEGEITWHGRTESFVGNAWMDREFGTWRTTENQKGWDWFSIQLNSNTELMIYHIRDAKGQPSVFSSGTYVDADGRFTHLTRDEFKIVVLDHWTSSKTGTIYPIKWRIQVPRFGIDLLVTPVMQDQELDTRGTTMIVYWEGSCLVRGRHGSESIEGRAYVELVGYDRSHEQPALGTFIFGDSLDKRWRSIFA